MNLFEDLIEELKEENLLEETVIETSQAESDALPDELAIETEPVLTSQTEQDSVIETVEPIADLPETAVNDSQSKANFYRQRAMDEVAFLQMVESAFAGVEREQLKTVPKPYDDLEVKKVLHSFLQVSQVAESPEHKQAEFKLLQETENWYSALAVRDKRLSTANLRRYCETSRPPLSSPALVALARFYRNAPYSELVRNKFDLVVTRLFTKEISGNRREMVFSRDELVTHLNELYAEWASVTLYATEPDDSKIREIVSRFEEFIEEADNSKSFDELITSDFFVRLPKFKESVNENFYAPPVTAAGIESNVHIGNRYIEFLRIERETADSTNLETRYGVSHDQMVSEVTGKTVSLIELLNQKAVKPPPVEEKPVVVIKPEPIKKEIRSETKAPEAVKEKKVENASSNPYKWLIAAAILAVIIIGGIYFGTKSDKTEVKDLASAPKLSLENSMLKEYLKEARVQDGTLHGIVLPTWNHLTEEKKKDVLKKMLNFGGEKGYKKVQLVNKDNKTIGTAADGEISVLD